MAISKSLLCQILATFVVTVGVFGMGTVLGWSSPALPSMASNETDSNSFSNLSKEEESWVGSSASLGAFFACPFAGFCIEKFGRKRTLVIFSPIFVSAWILISASKNVWLICVGRFFTGFCGGTFTLTAPVYVGEIAEKKIRGMLMNLFQIMLVSGILFTYLLGTFVSWKLLSMICGVIPILFIFGSFLIPESPRYLLSKGDREEAQKAFLWLRGSNSLEGSILEEYQEMKTAQNSTNTKPTFRDLLSPNVLKPLAVSLSLMLLEQLSAYNVVIFYCVDIFNAAGVKMDAYTASNCVAGVQVLVTIAATPLVDIFGRRILLILSEAFMGLSFIALGAYFYLKDHQLAEGIGWLPMTSIIVFIVAFAIGIGPLSWTVMGEILHPDVKGLCSAIAVAVVWFSAFFVTKIYQTLVTAVGTAWAFWIFSLVSIIGTFIVLIFVPETKGKSLDEIQKLFRKNEQKDNNLS